MMGPLEIIGLTIEIISVLCGGGLLKLYIEHREKYAVLFAEHVRTQSVIDRHESEINQIKTEQSVARQSLTLANEKLDRQAEKLELLPQVVAKLDIFNRLLESVMPRREAEAKFQALEKRNENNRHRD